MDGGIHYTDPFSTPADKRTPLRRLRGRLPSGVSVWTSKGPDGHAGLTVSSLILGDGDPPQAFGLINDTTSLFEAIEHSSRFVIHLLPEGSARVADVFAGLYPSEGGVFSDVSIAESEWGPVLQAYDNRAYCSVIEITDAGYQKMVRGAIEKIEVSELDEPLVYFRGKYRTLKEEGGR